MSTPARPARVREWRAPTARASGWPAPAAEAGRGRSGSAASGRLPGAHLVGEGVVGLADGARREPVGARLVVRQRDRRPAAEVDAARQVVARVLVEDEHLVL